MFFVLSFVYLCIMCAITQTGSFGMQKQTWEYTPISLDANSSNEDMLKLEMKVERIGRGDYAVSGSVVINADFGDDQFIEAKAYRSPTGGKEYKSVPFKIKKQTIPDFLRTTYKTYIMRNVRECSNAPQAEGNEMPIVEKTTYAFSKCQISTENLPSYVMPGYYKIVVVGSGKLDAVLEFIAEVTEKAA